MTDAPISPLRRRMIEDMTVRKFATRTQEAYIRSVKNFSAFLKATPDTASAEDLRRYRLHLVASGAGVPTINNSLTALRFLFLVTLRKPAIVLDMPFVREARRLPVVLSPEEVARLLDAAPGLKYKAALSVAYGAGLRASEVISLKVGGIDSARMVIRVEQGKGRKDRYVMLSEHLLELLRAWWKAAHPQGWLFPGRDPVRPFGGPEAVLAYLSLYTHRIAISNSRLVALDGTTVTFKWKDYRAKGRDRAKLMTLAIDEFIRRFLIHVLPEGFHRIRHYGLFANGGRAANIAKARHLLNAPAPHVEPDNVGAVGDAEPHTLSHPCPCCGGRTIIIETFERGCTPRYRPPAPNPIDSS